MCDDGHHSIHVMCQFQFRRDAACHGDVVMAYDRYFLSFNHRFPVFIIPLYLCLISIAMLLTLRYFVLHVDAAHVLLYRMIRIMVKLPLIWCILFSHPIGVLSMDTAFS